MVERRRSNPDRKANGTFVTGHKKKRGRKLGIPNKLSMELKELILLAVAKLGIDGKGAGGALGYLKKIFWTRPELAVRLLEKILPMQITGAGGGPVQVFSLPPEMLKGLPTHELQLLEKVFMRLGGEMPLAETVVEPAGDAEAYAKAIGVTRH